MKPSSLKRILSLICVVALAFGMVGTSALAAVPMMSGAVAETPVGEHTGHTHVAAERPATQVGVRSTPTKDSNAELMAAGGTWTPPSTFDVSGNVTSTVGGYTLNFAKNGGSSSVKSAPGGTALVGKFKMTVTLNAGDKISVSYNVVNSGATGLEAKSVTLGTTSITTTKQDPKPNTIEYTSTAGGDCELSAGGYLAVYSITISNSCAHVWGDGVETTPATCTTKGVKTFTCSKCGDTKTEEIAMLAHSYTVEKTAKVEPTCGKAGATAVMQCANCTATQGGEPIPATGEHNWGSDGKCTVCGAVNPDLCQHTNKATVAHKDATCTETGVQGGEYCADCGEGKAAAEKVLEVLGHNFVNGTCTRCGAQESTGFIAEAGWLESAYATWAITPGVTSYTAYVAPAGTESWTPLDKELIREYPGYMRVDALGLKAGSYKLKVVDNNGKEMITNDLTVEAHDRSGFAFVNGTASGAYNDDGTLKANAEVIYVTKASDIEQYQKSEVWNNKDNKATANPVCVRVIGHVKLSNVMGFQDWTTGLTVEGVGNDALLTGGGVFVKGSTNVEVRNLGVMHVPSSGKNDLIAVEQTNDHIWVHNNDLFYGFAGSGDQAKGDGSLDVKDAEYCSFSYNHFWDSGKCSLLGNGSSENYITYHHNWFDHSDSRHPRTRGGDKGGNVHVYNNYYDGVSKYGIGTTSGSGTSRASVFIEANYFRNTKYPIMNSKQASDSNGSGGSNTFSGDNPGFNKVWNNVMVGSKNFVSQLDDPDSFDGYVVSSRDEKVPDSVSAGGSKYNNFDTSMDLGVATVQEPKDAVITVTNYAGRVNGGDIQYDFDDTIEDTNYAVIEELNSILNSYQTTLVSVGGTVTNAVAAEHTHRPGTWLITKAPGCDPATQKVVNGEETQYCLDCGEALATRSLPGAHSNDGSGVCQVCGEKVSNSGGPAADPNAKILKASDFKDLAKGDAVTQDMLDAKYEGYFKSEGTGMKAGQSSTSNPVTDHLSLPNTGNGGVSFTVTNGPAKVTVQASSTGKGKSSVMVLKNANGVAVADKNNATSITVKENVSAATTVTYEVPAGTYTLYSEAGQTNGVRLIQLTVSEAEATCDHTNKIHTASVAATCETAGNIEYWTCSECSKTFSDEACTKEVTNVTIKALGHNMKETTPKQDATCLVDGKTAVLTCANGCGRTEGGAVIKAPGHTEATRTENSSGATCTTPGSYDLVTYCSVCNTVIKTEHKDGVLAPHTTIATAAKKATCVAEGNIAYWTCSVCSKTFSDAACTTEVTKVTTEKDPANHVGGTEVKNAKPATSTEDGYTGDTCCKSCGKVLTQGEVIPKITGSMSKLLKGADQDTQAAIQAIKAGGKDIAQKGWATDGQTFKMGGNDTVKDFFTVYYSANSKVDTTEKTWDFEGNYYTTGVDSAGVGIKETRFNLGGKGDTSKMKNLISFTTTKPATVKIWWVQAGGKDLQDDSKSSAIRNIALWNSAKTQVWTSASTATDKNTAEFDQKTDLPAGTYYLGGSDNSNYFFMVEVIEEGDIARTWAKPTEPVDPSCTHANKTHTAATTATCEADGNIEYWTCTDCEKTFSDEACTKEVTNVTIAKLGHDMKETAPAVAATCTEDGKTAVLTCANGCGKTEGGTTVAKLGHDLKEVPGTAVAPTETQDGKAADKKCSRCDYTEQGAVIPATGKPTEVDKKALTEAISKANTAKGTATVSTNGSNVSTSAKWVTADEMKALTDAIDAAKAVNDKTDATQAEVDKAVTDLNAAVTDFEAAKKAGTKSNGGGSSRPSGGSSGGGSSKPSTEDLDDTKVPLAGGPELNSKDHTAYITGYPDGTVGAERNITRQETAAIFYRLLTEQSKAIYGTSSNDFDDIADDHWAVKEISTLAKAGIVKGLPDGSFGPERSITRAEFITMAARFFTVNTTGTNPFADVAGHWAEKEILFAYSKGWVQGLPDGSFAPDQLITRAEAMRIINNVLDRKVDAAGMVEGAKQFSDVSESAWYYYDVMEATNGHTYTHEDGAAERWTELSK